MTPVNRLTNTIAGVSIAAVLTILVGTGMLSDRSVIVGASYEGTILALDYRGHRLCDQPNRLTGSMVRDLRCGDVDGDGNHEIREGLADRNVYCLYLDNGTMH